MAVYTVTTYTVDVVGRIWQPGITASLRYTVPTDVAKHILTLHESERREAIQDWLDIHSGDFRSVDDFAVSLADWESPWATEEGEATYLATMEGSE